MIRKNRTWIYLSAIFLSPLVSGIFLISPVLAADWSSPQVKIISVHTGESIQAAIDQAKSGSIILVSPGTYYGPVQLKSGITLRSEAGAQKTVIDGQGRSQPIVIGADDCTLEGFTITGQGRPEDGKSPVHAVECNDTSPALKNNFIAHNYGTGIWVKGKQAKPEIVGNRIYSNGGAGIGNEEGSRAVILKNECCNNSKSGIGVRSGAAPRIEGNRIYSNKMAGVGVQKDCSPLIKDNQCYLNTLSGIGIQGGSPVLEGNQLYNNGRCGVGVREGATVVATANTVTGNTLAGIGVQEGSTITLKNNTINENVLAAVTLTDGCIGSIIGNKIEKNGTQGVVCSASRVDIRDNVISDNIHHGIGIYRFSKAEVTGNKLINNGASDKRGAGVIVVSSSETNIHHNLFDNNYGPGVYAHRCSPAVEHNEFVNDLVYAKDKACPVIAYNIFYNSGKSGGKKVRAGVYVLNGSNPLIKQNEFYGKFAISIRYDSRPQIIGNIFSGSHQESIASGRSGVKIDNSTPIIKENIFYTGNKILVKGKLYAENLTLYYSRNKLKPVSNQTLQGGTKIDPENLITIADNLFLD